jgi:hypothetical protein
MWKLRGRIEEKRKAPMRAAWTHTSTSALQEKGGAIAAVAAYFKRPSARVALLRSRKNRE